ncbi:MAG: RdgB/HAM1 family non-canonical purine NTP pyrophosphatase [Cyanobacteriota bacterium]
MLDKIVFASKNKGKIREVKQLFSNINVEVLQVPEDFDVIENGETFLDNALIKAKKAVGLTRQVSLADDSGLMVDALNGEPGVHSSRYADTDIARISKLLKALEGIPCDKRTARFVCSLVLVSTKGEVLHSTSGVCEGTIIFEPRGSDGFGFDPVFLVPELNLTMAQIPLEQKNTLSHRARAFNQMLKWISVNN